MAKITLSNGWCFEEAYDLNAMSHITGFSVKCGSDVFVIGDKVDWAVIESALFHMFGAGILYGFNHRDGSNYIRIQAYTKHITEII
jgi:hypothetical protein